jgi:hypothetical protein
MPHGPMSEPALPPCSEPAPAEVSELAEACVRYVEKATGIVLDYQPETLPVLDHYVASRRAEVLERPEALSLVVRAVGAYFGEVFRRRVGAFWQVVGGDPSLWEIRARAVYLSFCPFAVAYDAIAHGDEGGPTSPFQLEDDDREAVDQRLGELPAVSEEEFYLLSTRLEVLDIAIDVVKSRMMHAGLGEVELSPDDYD